MIAAATRSADSGLICPERDRRYPHRTSGTDVHARAQTVDRMPAGALRTVVWYAAGNHAGYTLGELPDDVTAASLAVKAAASGACRSLSTTKLITMDEALEAFRRAGGGTGGTRDSRRPARPPGRHAHTTFAGLSWTGQVTSGRSGFGRSAARMAWAPGPREAVWKACFQSARSKVWVTRPSTG
jgi:hypothetical protein